MTYQFLVIALFYKMLKNIFLKFHVISRHSFTPKYETYAQRKHNKVRH